MRATSISQVHINSTPEGASGVALGTTHTHFLAPFPSALKAGVHGKVFIPHPVELAAKAPPGAVPFPR